MSRRTWWRVLLALAAVALAGAVPAQSTARAPTTFRLKLFPGAHRAATVWLSANDGGIAVGQKILPSGATHPVWYDGRHGHDIAGLLGTGALGSVDALGEAAGYRSVGTGATAQTFPLFYRPGGNPITLNDPGRATGITIGPLVAVTTRTTKGSPLAEAWNPRTGGTLFLGLANTTGVNARGVFVGRADDGKLWYAKPDGRGGAQAHELPWQGNFTGINDFDVAHGYIVAGGGPKPISYAVDTGKLTRYALPRGYRYESLTVLNDAGAAGGNAFRTARDLQASRGLAYEYPTSRGPVLIESMFRGLSPELRIGDVSAITDGGLIFGAVRRGQFDIAYLLSPPPIRKLIGLAALAREERWVRDSVKRLVIGGLRDIGTQLRRGKVDRACRDIGAMRAGLSEEANFLETEVGPIASPEINLYDTIALGIREVRDELGCQNAVRIRLVEPSRSQSQL